MSTRNSICSKNYVRLKVKYIFKTATQDNQYEHSHTKGNARIFFWGKEMIPDRSLEIVEGVKMAK